MRRCSAPIGLLLVLSLLFAQWLGYAHAFAHTTGAPELSQPASWSDGAFGHAKSAGSCAAFDAAALGAGLQSPPPPLLPSLPASRPVALPLRTGWHRLFTAHFSTRAPPLNA